jgi:hypothetical protein
MRAAARIPHALTITRETEGQRWLVELVSDGTVRATLDRGTASIAHRGTRASVRTRLAIDAEPRDLAAIDAAARDT